MSCNELVFAHILSTRTLDLEKTKMTRIAYAAAASIAFIATYSLSPLVAVGIAAVGAAVITGMIAVALRQAETREIEHVMNIIDACTVADRQAAGPLRLVS